MPTDIDLEEDGHRDSVSIMRSSKFISKDFLFILSNYLVAYILYFSIYLVIKFNQGKKLYVIIHWESYFPKQFLCTPIPEDFISVLKF
jgi:hypothetical protein